MTSAQEEGRLSMARSADLIPGLWLGGLLVGLSLVLGGMLVEGVADRSAELVDGGHAQQAGEDSTEGVRLAAVPWTD